MPTNEDPNGEGWGRDKDIRSDSEKDSGGRIRQPRVTPDDFKNWGPAVGGRDDHDQK